jgi:aminoglycoside phosphotransferase (APT) family kinase protein
VIVDPTAKDPAFREGRLPDMDLLAAVEQARAMLGVSQPWRLISARRKLGKALFEVQEGDRRLIGIISRSERMGHAFASLRAVWEAGMRPPAACTVVEPVGHAPELNLMVMEKAGGQLLWQTIERGSEYALEHTEMAAQWLAALHGLSVDAPAWSEDRNRIEHWGAQLKKVLPHEAPRIGELLDGILERVNSQRGELVPSHGDFHGGNLFIAAGPRITVIDLDKFGLREREFDIAYFLAQTACMGFWARGSFNWTQPFRERFLRRYERLSGAALDFERLNVYMAATLLQNLNYDLSVFKTGRVEIAPAFLELAETCVFAPLR